ncbi:MAG TPA: oxidoreductase [Candidatus Angelobacter sp.]
MNDSNVNPRTALLVGGSGLVGGYCLQALLEEPVYEAVISVGRRPLPDAMHARLQQKVLPLETISSLELPRVNDVFCALGTTIRKAGSQLAFRQVDYELPLAVANYALKFGAEQFVLVSSVGADSRSTNFYLRTKGELEDGLKSLPFRAVHFLRPSLLLGARAESRPMESVAISSARLLQFLFVGPLRKYHPVDAHRVGRAMVSAVRNNGSSRSVYEYDGIMRLHIK